MICGEPSTKQEKDGPRPGPPSTRTCRASASCTPRMLNTRGGVSSSNDLKIQIIHVFQYVKRVFLLLEPCIVSTPPPSPPRIPHPRCPPPRAPAAACSLGCGSPHRARAPCSRSGTSRCADRRKPSSVSTRILGRRTAPTAPYAPYPPPASCVVVWVRWLGLLVLGSWGGVRHPLHHMHLIPRPRPTWLCG